MGGLEVIDRGFAVIHERALAVLRGDERVASVSVGGSVGAGTADEWSDLDLQVVAHPDGYDDLLADWPTWLAAITPTVFARTPILPFVINTVTNEGLTLDITVFKGEAFEVPPATGHAVGMLSGVRFAELGPALDYAVVEQLRGMAGPFVSLVQREEHLRHLTGVPHLLGLLTTVFLAELDAPPMGKHWNRTLTPEQRGAVAALPPVRATREDIVAFGLGLAELLVTRARPLYPRYGLEWPTDLATVTATRLRDCLDIDASRWLH
ncbi:MAG: nucleotidyltransferase domain-containing protein [Acidimicrobiales bacterium]